MPDRALRRGARDAGHTAGRLPQGHGRAGRSGALRVPLEARRPGEARRLGRTYSGDINRTVWPCSMRVRPMWWAPQHASMATMQAGSFAPKAIRLSRRIRRRSTTRPVASSPTRLQLFLPRSIPRTAIVIVSLHPSSRPPCNLSSAAR